jgi:hypothetical protein
MSGVIPDLARFWPSSSLLDLPEIRSVRFDLRCAETATASSINNVLQVFNSEKLNDFSEISIPVRYDLMDVLRCSVYKEGKITADIFTSSKSSRRQRTPIIIMKSSCLITLALATLAFSAPITGKNI